MSDPTQMQAAVPGRVNILRTRAFVDLLTERMGTGEVRAALAGLPADVQARLHPRGSGWLDQQVERDCIELLCSAFGVWPLVEESGREIVTGHLTQVLSALPGLAGMMDILDYIPSLVAVFQTGLKCDVRETSANPPRYDVSFTGAIGQVEILFYRGFLGGILQFLEAVDPQVVLENLPGENGAGLVYKVSAFSLQKKPADQKREAARLGWNTTAKEAFVKQVIARSSRLLRDKRELTTAVEYLNSANDELDHQIRANQKELSMAGNIQRSFVPALIPDWEGIQFWVHYSPLREVSGDLYDSFALSDDRLALLVADVSGHGVPAALISSIAKISFQTHRSTLPSDIFSNVNLDLINYVKMEGYLTATYMIIDRQHQMTYSVAAMPGPYLHRARTGEVIRLPGRGTMLGMFPNATDYLSNQTIRLEPGDRVFVFTDGLVEATNARGDFFGEENLTRVMHQTAGLGARESCETLIDQYRRFILGSGAHDDLTVVVFAVSEHREAFEQFMREADELFRLGEIVAAGARIERAVALFPRHPEALYRYSKYLARSGRYDAALEHIEELKKMRPNMANAYTIQGYCNYRLGRLERAAADLKRSLAIRSENPSALFHLVRVFRELGREEEARRALLELKYLEPEHPLVRSLKLNPNQNTGE